eukprot:gi/632978708/ref/XP_007906066.1/ PREDICTED: cadherin-16 [Callorhinchus milii]
MFSIRSMHISHCPQVLLLVLVAGGPCLHAAREVLVSENYVGTFPYYLTRIGTGVAGTVRLDLVRDYDGLFGIEAPGLLFATMSFDRETQDLYELKVNVTDAMGEELAPLISIDIRILDQNDNAPRFLRPSYSASVHQGAKPGFSIVSVTATDPDDPSLPNADLRYTIFTQHPAPTADLMFQIHRMSGVVSVSEEGAVSLDPSRVDEYQLAVEVKDMGDQKLGHFTRVNVTIRVTENIWLPPPAVTVSENHAGPYPMVISKVQWNADGARYQLERPHGQLAEPFSIGDDGNIYLIRPLDHEQQAEYLLLISAVDKAGMLYDEPLELTVTVSDVNDNAPACFPHSYRALLRETAPEGTELVTLGAVDADDPSTENAHLSFRLVRQTPLAPGDPVFTVTPSGLVTLATAAHNRTAARYSLNITVTDRGGEEGGLWAECLVTVEVEEVNDHAPAFPQQQYGPFTVREDTGLASPIATLNASDADRPGTDSWFITYTFLSGNHNHTFHILHDRESNTGRLVLNKTLDYETEREFTLIIAARNEVELVDSVYGPSGTATVSVTVQDVNEPPVFTHRQYQVSVPRDITPGSSLLTLSGYDPDTPHTPIRYHLEKDMLGWLSIDGSGTVSTVRGLGWELAGTTYTVLVVAEDTDNTSLSVAVPLLIHLETPTEGPGLGREGLGSGLVLKKTSGGVLCTPRREAQSLSIRVTTREGTEPAAPLVLTLASDALIQRNWRLQQTNNTHAYLTFGFRWVTPRVHLVAIVVSVSGPATASQSQSLTLPVTVCTCGSGDYCRMELEPVTGKPTILSAVAILGGALGVAALILMVTFTHLSVRRRRESVNPEALPLQPARY